MTRACVIIFLIFFSACNSSAVHTNALPNNNDTLSDDGITMSARFDSFDTTVDVLFENTKDSISDIQRKDYEGFISKQDSLTPEILEKIFQYYKQAYPDYKKGWISADNIDSAGLAKNLPPPTTP